jgi:hypothetical protein
MFSMGGIGSVSGEAGSLAIGGISGGNLGVGAVPVEWFGVLAAGDRTRSGETARFGASEMTPQPWEAEASAVMSIQAPSRRFKVAASECAFDLKHKSFNESPRTVTSAMTMPQTDARMAAAIMLKTVGSVALADK